MIHIASFRNFIVLSVAVATCLLATGSVRAQNVSNNVNAVVCPQMPPGVPSTNVPQPPKPRAQLNWKASLLQESPNVRVVKSPHFLARVRQDADRQVIFITGTFTLEDRPEIASLAQVLVRGKNTIVSFNFGGGSGGAIMDFKNLIQGVCNADAGCVVRTEVSSGHRCASFCIALFMMGQIRVADVDAEFGFHSATIGACKIPGDAERQYREVGVSPMWLEQHPQYFFERDVTWLGPLQIMGSGIVTHVAAPKK